MTECQCAETGGVFYCRTCGGMRCEHQSCECHRVTCPNCGHQFEK